MLPVRLAVINLARVFYYRLILKNEARMKKLGFFFILFFNVSSSRTFVYNFFYLFFYTFLIFSLKSIDQNAVGLDKPMEGRSQCVQRDGGPSLWHAIYTLIHAHMHALDMCGGMEELVTRVCRQVHVGMHRISLVLRALHGSSFKKHVYTRRSYALAVSLTFFLHAWHIRNLTWAG